MADLTIKPTRATTMEEKPSILSMQMGEGYRQLAGDGINSNAPVWNVAWENIDQAVLYTLVTFFRSKAGYTPFTWEQPPPFDAEGELSFTCDEGWKVSWQGGRIMSITATLRRFFLP